MQYIVLFVAEILVFTDSVHQHWSWLTAFKPHWSWLIALKPAALCAIIVQVHIILYSS